MLNNEELDFKYAGEIARAIKNNDVEKVKILLEPVPILYICIYICIYALTKYIIIKGRFFFPLGYYFFRKGLHMVLPSRYDAFLNITRRDVLPGLPR